MRARINDAVKTAMKAGDKPRVATLRLITAAIKNQDLQQPAGTEPAGDAEITAVLQKCSSSGGSRLRFIARTLVKSWPRKKKPKSPSSRSFFPSRWTMRKRAKRSKQQ